MSNSKKLIRNIIILAAMLFAFFWGSNLYLTPLAAHKHSERGIHYGPSEVVHIEDFEKGKYLLCKYDNWISCNTVKMQFFFLWGFGDQPIGIENKKDQKLTYTWQMSDQYYVLYGVINDSSVKKVKITYVNGETKLQSDFYDNMFLFTWKDPKNDNNYVTKIQGYDINGNVIYDNDVHS